MPRISHVRPEYTVYQGDHILDRRWFGLVHRKGVRVFSCTIEAANETEALTKLKEKYAAKPALVDHVIGHD